MDLQYFWYTQNSLDATGLTFGTPLFGSQHLLELSGALLLCAVLALVFRRLPAQKQQRWLQVLCVLIVADELFKHLGSAFTGQWTAAYLPLHMCSINIFIIALQTLHPARCTQELIYCLCLPAALVAMLTPTWLDEPTLNFMRLHSLSIHFFLLLYSVLQLASGWRPDVRRLPRSFAILLAMAVPVFVLNKLFTRFDIGSSANHAGTNFMFLNYPEPGTPMALFGNWFGQKYGFLLGMPILLALVWAVMYAPFCLLRRVSQTSDRLHDT